jgi:hypothetical protein
MDDVAIWSTALTATEIQTIYARQSASYSGTITSRVMDYGSSRAWSGLKWLTSLPFGKELPGDVDASGTITSADSETSTDYPSLVGSTGSTSDNNLMSGLVGLWRLNGTPGVIADAASVPDSGPNGYTGSVVDSDATNTISYATSNFSEGIRFDGANDHVTVSTMGNFGSTQIGSTTAISLWLRTNSSTPGTLVGTVNSNSTTSFLLRTNITTAGNIQFFLRDNSNRSLRFITAGGIVDDQWHHVAVNVNPATMSGEIWVDGVSKTLNYSGSSGSVSGFSNFTYPMAIGILNGASLLQPFNGYIDEVAIWGRNLNASEIRQLYRRGANRIKYQVRTCVASDCSDDPTWIGPDNTNGTYMSELHNYAPYNFDVNNCSATNLIRTGSPSLLFSCFSSSLSNLAPRRYFQYRAILESDDASTNCDYGSGATWCSPELRSVEVKP